MLDLADQAIQALRSSPYGAAGPGLRAVGPDVDAVRSTRLQRAVENLRSNATELNRRARCRGGQRLTRASRTRPAAAVPTRTAAAAVLQRFCARSTA